MHVTGGSLASIHCASLHVRLGLPFEVFIGELWGGVHMRSSLPIESRVFRYRLSANFHQNICGNATGKLGFTVTSYDLRMHE